MGYKGDWDRTADRERYRKNLDRIFGKKEPPADAVEFAEEMSIPLEPWQKMILRDKKLLKQTFIRHGGKPPAPAHEGERDE